MAGDWIKVEKATARKPEVLRIAELLTIHPDHAFGLCVRFWSWCDDHLKSGNAAIVSEVTLDTLLDRSGFSKALIEVGWLQARNGSLAIPNFDRHLSQTAKKRSLTSRRVATHKKRKGNADGVTSALPREEKRREENTVSPIGDTKARASPFVRPTLDEVREYCRERANSVDAEKWMAYYESNGWRVGRNAMKDWRAAVRSWEKNDYDSGRTGITRHGGGSGGAPNLLEREQRREQQQFDILRQYVEGGGLPAGD